MIELIVRLTDEQIERLADSIGERLCEAQQVRLVDAATLAQELGVSRDFVYAHACDLGGERIGAGPRGRLRFDRDRALSAWAGRPTKTAPHPGRRSRSTCDSVARRRRSNHQVGLLPVRPGVPPGRVRDRPSAL